MKANLTDRYLASLKPPDAGRLEVSDIVRRGLRVRVTRDDTAKGKDKKRIVWMYEKRVKGGAKRKHTLGTYPTLPLGEARQLALELEAEAARGIDRVAIEQARRLELEAAKATQQTVRQVIDVYAELHLSQLRTGPERKRQLLTALAQHLDRPISDLSHKDIQHAVDAKLLAGRKVFANRIRAALVAFANWAWVRGYLPENIGARVAKPTKESARERVLSVQEVQEIYEASEALGPLWCPLIRLLILTGQRRSEITDLRWEEVDQDRSRITKPGSLTKNGKPHITHLSEPALDTLQSLKARRKGLIFTTTGDTPVSGLSRVKRRLDALLAPEFEPWRFHDIRTAMATALADAGESETVVDRILNHSASGSAPSAVARVYNQSEQLPQRARALDRWADLVTGQTGHMVRLKTDG